MLPVFSPDGWSIAFVSGRPGGAELYIMGADGLNRRRLTDLASDFTQPPVFNPDGRWLTHVAGPGRQAGLYLVRADGSEPAILVHPGPTHVFDPVFGAHGRALTFASGPAAAMSYALPGGGSAEDATSATRSAARPAGAAR